MAGNQFIKNTFNLVLVNGNRGSMHSIGYKDDAEVKIDNCNQSIWSAIDGTEGIGNNDGKLSWAEIKEILQKEFTSTNTLGKQSIRIDKAAAKKFIKEHHLKGVKPQDVIKFFEQVIGNIKESKPMSEDISNPQPVDKELSVATGIPEGTPTTQKVTRSPGCETTSTYAQLDGLNCKIKDEAVLTYPEIDSVTGMAKTKNVTHYYRYDASGRNGTVTLCINGIASSIHLQFTVDENGIIRTKKPNLDSMQPTQPQTQEQP